MQQGLFDAQPAAASIPGLVYEPAFLEAGEEQGLIELVRSLPLHAAKYKQYEARRRVTSFGGSFDYDSNTLLPAEPLDERLLPLRERVASWLGVAGASLVHALVAEYSPGTPLGWHRDVPDFETICGVSLGGSATLRFRPYPYHPGLVRQRVQLEVERRSIYKLEGPARWAWQHSVSPTRELRWSITFRTARRGP